jgi:hypothetical protein
MPADIELVYQGGRDAGIEEPVLKANALRSHSNPDAVDLARRLLCLLNDARRG